MFDEVTEEVNRERNKPPPVEEYCTEYDGNYNADGYKNHNEHEANPEVKYF